MKKIHLISSVLYSASCCVLMLLMGCNQSQEVQQALETTLTQLKKEHQLDRRTQIFDFTIKQENGQYSLQGQTNLPEIKQQLLAELNQWELVDSVQLLPESSLGDSTYAVVAISVANMRAAPDLHKEMSSQALMGEVLKLYKQQGKWFYVQTPDKYLGWMHSGAFVRQTPQEIEQYRQQPKLLVKARNTFAYASPAMKEVVTELIEQDVLVNVNTQKNPSLVKLPSGEEVYVASNALENTSQRAKRVGEFSAEHLKKVAKKYLGVNYLWGGTSVKGMDCSGFTKTVMGQFAIDLHRDASQQVLQGEGRDLTRPDSWQAGDLLFFGRQKKGKTRVTHVAVFLGGNEYIHSAGTKVRINSLDPENKLFNQDLKKRLCAVRAYHD